MRLRFPLLMLAVLATPALRTVGGQVCLGYAPFSSGPARASAGYHDASATDEFRGGLGYGFNHSDFGVLGFQHTAARNREPGYKFSSNVVDGMLGREFSLGSSSARLCPIGRLGYYSSSLSFLVLSTSDTVTSRMVSGSNFARGLTYDFGGAFGFNASDGPTHIVPSLAVEYFGTHLNGDVTFEGKRQTVSLPDQPYGQWTLALGINAHGLTIAPYIDRKFRRGAHTIATWGVNAAINFGSVRQ